MAFWVKSDCCNWSRCIVNNSVFFDISEFKDFDLLILSACDNEVTFGRNGKAVDVSIMSFEVILNVEGLIVPNFQISIPSN